MADPSLEFPDHSEQTAEGMLGTAHGGVVSALADHVLGSVMYPVMASGQWAATTEFKPPPKVAPASQLLRRAPSRSRTPGRGEEHPWNCT